jgi:hypothetical protein
VKVPWAATTEEEIPSSLQWSVSAEFKATEEMHVFLEFFIVATCFGVSHPF